MEVRVILRLTLVNETWTKVNYELDLSTCPDYHHPPLVTCLLISIYTSVYWSLYCCRGTTKNHEPNQFLVTSTGYGQYKHAVQCSIQTECIVHNATLVKYILQCWHWVQRLGRVGLQRWADSVRSQAPCFSPTFIHSLPLPLLYRP